MSYQLVEARARSKDLSAEWAVVDVTNITIGTLFTTYSNVWLTLSHTALDHNVYLELNSIREALAASYSSLTLAQWLTQNGNGTLPTQNTAPKLGLKLVKYSDAWRAGYDIKPINRFRSDDSQLAVGDKHDLLMSKTGVDFMVYHRYAMVSVNGFFHRVAGSTTGLQVIEGNRSGRLANDNQIGIHSFREVGRLEYLPITPSMIFKTVEDQGYKTRAYLQLPAAASDKIALLVLGGYLHVLDEVYTRTGPTTLCINFNKLAWPERYFDSRRFIDLQSLPLTLDPDNPTHVAVEDLYSDAVLQAYMTLPQSFVVLVNAKDFFARKRPTVNIKLPGRFEVPTTTERLPMFGAWGKVYDYAIFPDWGTHVLACSENQKQNYLFRTTKWQGDRAISAVLDAYRPWDWSDAYMLEMGRFG
ncbi:hypothetical protein LUCX_309 [Xanthomonas phage vB_XciM_LucasX]|nr:hypothetical protein LUCX_309 [Xanthomonas phage vB_XciM_LucasX]